MTLRKTKNAADTLEGLCEFLTVSHTSASHFWLLTCPISLVTSWTGTLSTPQVVPFAADTLALALALSVPWKAEASFRKTKVNPHASCEPNSHLTSQRWQWGLEIGFFFTNLPYSNLLLSQHQL